MTMEKKEITGLITPEEISAAEFCLNSILRHGAQQARVSLSKSVLDTTGMLNGQLDKVSHSSDRSVFMYIFADGRYGTFSTNMFDRDELENFTLRAVNAVKLLAEDPLRKLPDISRTAKDAVTGRELGLFDEEYGNMCAEQRFAVAESETMTGKFPETDKCRVISEECEYSDSVDDNLLIDSSGFVGRHTETSFSLSSEVTVEDSGGRKFSGWWWESSPFAKNLKTGTCSATALERAARQIGPKACKSGKYTLVTDTTVSSRLISPIISALNAFSIQQKTSFLEDTAGKKVFSDGLMLMDLARTPGRPGSRLYDTEGVATSDAPIIKEGTVCNYFVNTYMAAKTGLAPTIEGVSRPVLMPYNCGQDTGASALMKLCGEGIYVTGFNGGNCNPVTGDFSYGIEGFAFRDGKILHPIREMLITGNMMTLWNSLMAAGDDARACTRWQIPSLAFENVDFSG